MNETHSIAGSTLRWIARKINSHLVDYLNAVQSAQILYDYICMASHTEPLIFSIGRFQETLALMTIGSVLTSFRQHTEGRVETKSDDRSARRQHTRKTGKAELLLNRTGLLEK